LEGSDLMLASIRTIVAVGAVIDVKKLVHPSELGLTRADWEAFDANHAVMRHVTGASRREAPPLEAIRCRREWTRPAGASPREHPD
jgi:hypothetical protein